MSCAQALTLSRARVLLLAPSAPTSRSYCTATASLPRSEGFAPSLGSFTADPNVALRLCKAMIVQHVELTQLLGIPHCKVVQTSCQRSVMTAPSKGGLKLKSTRSWSPQAALEKQAGILGHTASQTRADRHRPSGFVCCRVHTARHLELAYIVVPFWFLSKVFRRPGFGFEKTKF